MDVSLLVKHRLRELGLEQKDLAAAANVTESYISQLLARKKAPPAPARTDIYDRIGEYLKLPAGELSRLADLQRQEHFKKRVVERPAPLFAACRELILNKCNPARRPEIGRIFEKEPFGEFERLVTQKLLDIAQGEARAQSHSEEWLRHMGRLYGAGYEEMRAAIQRFLDTDVFGASVENCVSFLDLILESWDMDLKSFAMEAVLNGQLAPERIKRIEFIEREAEDRGSVEPGLEQFLKDSVLSRDITEEEIVFLARLRFHGRRPSPLYYYRELQNLRDPLHFSASGNTLRPDAQRSQLPSAENASSTFPGIPPSWP